jgi:hypothetical protein
MIKGAALRSMLVATEGLYGADGLAAVLARLSDEHRAVLAAPLAVQFYPVEISAGFHDALRSVHGKGTWAPSYAVGLAAARIDFTGVYRVLLRAVSYDLLWDRMEAAWKQYNSEGVISLAERGTGFVRGHATGAHGYNGGLWHSVAGRGAGLVLLAGAKSAEGKVVSFDAASCRLEITWQP